MFDYSIVTSFNTRLFNHSAQLIYKNLFEIYPDINTYIYHENSFDKKYFNTEIIWPLGWSNCHKYDLYIELPWVEKWLVKSGFDQRCREAPIYWNKNAIFWFRKILTLHDCLNKSNEHLLIWTDCDVKFNVRLPDQIIDWGMQHDICCVLRRNQAIDSGFIIFNLKAQGKAIIDQWLNFYLKSLVYNEERWDDGYILDLLLKKSKYSIGNLNKNKDGTPNIFNYIRHLKGPLKRTRVKFIDQNVLPK